MAIEFQIQEQLEKVARRRRQAILWGKLAVCWVIAAAIGLGILGLERESGWSSSLVLPVVGLLGLAGAIIVAVKHGKKPVSWREVAGKIESQHPELNGRLVTAVQQQPGTDGQLSYLQRRLVLETIEYSRRSDWTDTVPGSSLRVSQAGHWAALGLFVVTLIGLRHSGGHQLFSRTFAEGLTVTPGDVSLERGSSLVVLAQFKGPLPPKVELVFGGPAALHSIPLVKSLGDPMFGGSIPEVSSDFVYHVEYRGERTRDFAVTVFEHPRLERADANLTFPDYTALAPKRIENTRRVSAVEGSHLDLALRFNKPVASAGLVSRDKAHTTIPLAVETNAAAANLKQFLFESSKTYDLQLVDSEGRTNKVPADFVFAVLKNRTPELHLTSPRGDLRPSPLEEIPFEGTVWDDFGVRTFGLAYAINGQAPKLLELGKNVPGNEKRSFHHVLRLEDLGVKPDELVSWFIWADDLGPDGQVRRTMGDLYFGEVRPFEEVFREGQGMDGQGGAGEGGGGNQTGQLADLQKQIVNATWRLERDHNSTPKGSPNNAPEKKDSSTRHPEVPGDQSKNESPSMGSTLPPALSRGIALVRSPGFSRHVVATPMAQVDQTDGSDATSEPPSARPLVKPSAAAKGTAPSYQEDASVVLDSQIQALEQAKHALQRQREPQAAGLWQNAVQEMEAAIKRLQAATNSPAALKEALVAEQAAYQALVRLEAHEYQVSRSRNRNQNGSGRNQQMQRQLEELDLKDSDNRYENQREAQRQQNPERREQLQIMSRLQELARRQQDLNERLKELQTALQEARTEQEREEIRRQLKRLQEEEQQMLADVDDLRQRMDRPENQSRLADERRQLDQTRQEVQKAAEAAGQNAASQALAAGTRAQSQLQQLRDEIRKKSSSQFADDLRQMRSQARELARQQEDILKKIQNESASDKKSLSDASDQEQTRADLARQKERMTNLVDRATQVSQQAEQAEPLLSQQLYDTVRKFTQNTSKDLKEAENDLMNHGPMTRSLYDLLKDDSEQGGVKLEEITSEMLRLGYVPQAGRVGERARTGIEELKKGVERAAESVLGDDAEELRLAQKQLDDLAKQLQNEINEGQGSTSQTNGMGSESGSNSAKRAAGNREMNTNQMAQARASGKNGERGRPSGNQSNPESADAREGSPNQGSDAQSSTGQAGSQSGDAQANNDGSQAGASAPNNSLADNGNRSGRRSANPTARDGSPGGAATGGDPANEALNAGPGGGARNWNWDRLRSESVRREDAPITGEGFTSWSDRLREVEQLLDEPDLRDDVTKARERARLFRQEFKRDRKKPDWAVLQLQVMKPLTEVRDRIADELARRESREALVPLDRDPVPNRYSDLVKRYYEGLGKQK
jgi:hypothetical protein